ncbi:MULTISPECIES: TolC family outer membrane protein [unclassified Polaromonas]|uniref:TolC family outer membrane protein n=1 Tax=unclassified Polaromonas TaxID=2638319 RepID=UPI001A1D7A0A|nr:MULTISPECIES: TolC family outer membrane protein [unclassified Polaromonas]MBG6073839.1 protease secretion system outer membrane protein [Polaromonas sp. CG_9.7]MBG6115859.1 protease secretion system outer membrane protein [Polaromonas sp. CG_9.2]
MTTLPLTRLLASLVCAAALGQGQLAFAADMPAPAPGQAPAAPALGLLQAYDAALANDPAYRAARHENEAGQEYKVLGKSHLLPVLSANYSTHKNRADITTASVQGDRTEQRNYTSLAAAVQLRQPLFYPEGIARYRQGMAQTLVSDAQFSARSQELIVRLVTLYAGAQYARDQLEQATAQRQAYAEQRQSVERMLQNGEGTRTEVLEAQAKLDLALAQLIEASDNLVNANDALAAVVGRKVTSLDPLSNDFQVRSMQPASFEEWKAVALANNPEILAQGLAVEIAREEINKIQAGHAPRLDLVASAGKNNSDTINTFSQKTNIASIGLQLTIPLYAGGSVSAAARQAASNHEKAQADLDTRTSQVLVELRKQYHLTQSSVSRIGATAAALRSAQLLVEATQKSVRGGQRTNLDVLNAQQQLYEARRDLSLARFNYLLGFLRLRYSAGTLGLADLKDIAVYFVASR